MAHAPPPQPQQLPPSCCTPLCLVTGPDPLDPLPSQAGAATRAGQAGGDDRDRRTGDGGALAPVPTPTPTTPLTQNHHHEVRVAGLRTSAVRGVAARVVASLGSRIVVDVVAPVAADGVR